VLSYFTIYQYTQHVVQELASQRGYTTSAGSIQGEDHHVGFEVSIRKSPTYAWVVETYVDVYQQVSTTGGTYYIRRRSTLKVNVIRDIVEGDECDPMQDYLPEKKFMLTFKRGCLTFTTVDSVSTCTEYGDFV
jgi:hypothetical protein